MPLTHQHIRVTWNDNNNNQRLIFKKDIGCSCCKVHIHCTSDRKRGDKTVSPHIASTHIPRRFIGCGSKTGEVSRESVSRDRFSHKTNNKIGMFHKIRFDKEKNVFILQEMYRVRNLTTNCDLRRHLLLNYRQFICIIMSIVQQYKW